MHDAGRMRRRQSVGDPEMAYPSASLKAIPPGGINWLSARPARYSMAMKSSSSLVSMS